MDHRTDPMDHRTDPMDHRMGIYPQVDLLTWHYYNIQNGIVGS